MDIVGVGLNATDTLIPLARVPASGAKVEFHSVSVLPGGQVATAMVACRTWGLEARYVGKLGDDSNAELHRSAFAAAGVDTRLFTARGCSSQQAFIMVEDSGERTVLWRRDDRLTLHPEDLRQEWILDSRALLVDGHDTAAALTAATWAREAGIPVIADIDDLYPGVERLIEKVDYLIVSRDMPERMTGKSDLREALAEVQQIFGCRLAGATLGCHGVLVRCEQEYWYAPAFRVEAVDTTGAGDIFHAGFIYGLLQDWQLPRILDFASAAAALNCTGHGARGGIQSVSRIEQLMATGKRYPADQSVLPPDLDANLCDSAPAR